MPRDPRRTRGRRAGRRGRKKGAWAESYADGPGLRNQFHNVAEFYSLYPDARVPEALNLCAFRPESGPALEAVLKPLVARVVAQRKSGSLRGSIDLITRSGTIEGWAQDMGSPELPVLLEVLLGARVMGTILACDYRDDLAKAGIGSGRCHFVFHYPASIDSFRPESIRIRRATDGAEILMSNDCKSAFYKRAAA
jgi:hypothetical protein